MTLIILNICCLVITIATLQAYVYLDAYSRVHRLLPVVLACFCLYHFYVRTKVHGIKSAAKQLGYEELGRKAEILEMAAKTQNVRFLNENMGDFMDTCGQYFEGR